MTKEEARAEINKRIDRETAYILQLSGNEVSNEGKTILKEKLEANDKIISLLGMWLESAGDEWEKFYREKMK